MIFEAQYNEAVRQRDEAVAALRELSIWSLPRWDPDDPQTEGEQMRLFAMRQLARIGEEQHAGQ